MLVSRKREWDNWQEEAPEVHKAPIRQISAGFRSKCFILVLVAAVTAMFVTIQSEAIVRAGYDLIQVKAQVAKMEQENEVLRLDIARMKSPQRIQYIATKELGMIVPQSVYCADMKMKADEAKVAVQEKTVFQSAKNQLLNLLQVPAVEASKKK